MLLDQTVSEFVNVCHDENTPFWLVKHAVLGFQTRFRYVRHHIPRCWDCLGAWEAKLERWSRKPIPLQVVEYLFAVSVSWALEDRARAVL